MIKWIFDLSLRHKLPIWGSLLIISTALAISLGFLYQAVGNIKHNMLLQSEVLGKSLAGALASAIKHDEPALANEIIHSPFNNEDINEGFRVEQLVVLDDKNRVVVSTDQQAYAVHAELNSLGPDFVSLRAQLAVAQNNMPVLTVGQHTLLTLPLLIDGVRRGYLVMVHASNPHMDRFRGLAQRTAWITLVVLAIVLPISWYWGARMAVPLVMLIKRMGAIGHSMPIPLPENVYAYGDEVGQLFDVYQRMCSELEEKEKMKQEMIRTERLAALGRLSAGVAHEINNPLAGLITAVDTMKHHGANDPVTARTLPLLERGLAQIKEIVGALLVENRSRSHPLTASDIEDVRTLLTKEASVAAISWQWLVNLKGEVSLPSTLVRQVLINLLLNAIHAAKSGGNVGVRINLEPHVLLIDVVNDGREIPADIREHLFEPFTGSTEGGHGLGLWVTYQIVQQLHGHIDIQTNNGQTRFIVTLPIGEG